MRRPSEPAKSTVFRILTETNTKSNSNEPSTKNGIGPNQIKHNMREYVSYYKGDKKRKKGSSFTETPKRVDQIFLENTSMHYGKFLFIKLQWCKIIIQVRKFYLKTRI